MRSVGGASSQPNHPTISLYRLNVSASDSHAASHVLTFIISSARLHGLDDEVPQQGGERGRRHADAPQPGAARRPDPLDALPSRGDREHERGREEPGRAELARQAEDDRPEGGPSDQHPVDLVPRPEREHATGGPQPETTRDLRRARVHGAAHEPDQGRQRDGEAEARGTRLAQPAEARHRRRDEERGDERADEPHEEHALAVLQQQGRQPGDEVVEGRVSPGCSRQRHDLRVVRDVLARRRDGLEERVARDRAAGLRSSRAARRPPGRASCSRARGSRDARRSTRGSSARARRGLRRSASRRSSTGS